jgi:hypothetical protein
MRGSLRAGDEAAAGPDGDPGSGEAREWIGLTHDDKQMARSLQHAGGARDGNAWPRAEKVGGNHF